MTTGSDIRETYHNVYGVCVYTASTGSENVQSSVEMGEPEMKTYERPVVLVNEELAEGVYAASGAAESADCWTVDATSVQDWNGSHHVFEVSCKHSTAVEHISSATTVTLTFSNTLTDAYSEFSSSFSGSSVTVVRELLADAYKSGDNVTYKVWVKAADEATTKAITCTGKTISCTKTVNVQGNGGDGN